VVGNSDALGVLAADACEEAGLVLAEPPRQLGPAASAKDFATALGQVLGNDAVDAVIALFIPPLVTRDEDVARVLAEAAGAGGKTVVASFLGMRGVPEALAVADGCCSVPSYPTPEDAVRALAAAVRYARWRSTPAGHTVSPPGLDVARARGLVAAALGAGTAGPEEPVPLGDDPLAELLGCYGIGLEAGAAGGEGTVACVLETLEDPLFGPVVSFGLSGVATDLLGDRAYRIPPLTDRDVREMVRSIGAFPLLQGHRGGPVADVEALERLVTRVARMADDLPQLSHLELDPVLVGEQGLTVAGATAQLARPQVRRDRGPRELPG
jgi:acyl-CoA synthetase (NDP forming)